MVAKKDVGEWQTGWKPLPLLLKILAVFLITGASTFLFSLGKNGFFFLGTILTGTPAMIVVLLLWVFGASAFLVALLNRYSWAWKYGMCYLGFFLINTLIAFTYPNIPSSALVILAIELVMNLVLILFLMRERKYFEGEVG